MIAQALRLAAAYVRMSTARQEDSPARQRMEIEQLAARDGYQIVEWYQDEALTGTESSKRVEFQRLMRDSQNGRFTAILMYEQSRFSREDVFEVMAHWKLLKDADVAIVTCQRGPLRFDDLGGLITAMVDQYGAHDESAKLAARVTSAQRKRATEGKRIGGRPFGYDREILDESGNVVKVVSYRETFHKPRQWTSRIVPTSEPGAVDALRWAFAAIAEGESVREVCREFNRRALTTPFGKSFTISTVTSMLRNPVYAGTLRAGYFSRGKFERIDREGIILTADAHQPIIEPALFDRVQRILAARRQTPTRAQPGQYLLTGLINCEHCGGRMYGVIRSEGRKRHRYYGCMNDQCREMFQVRADRIEATILRAFANEVLRDGVEKQIHTAILHLRRRDSSREYERAERELTAVRERIERAEANLAFAESKRNFEVIAAKLEELRAQEARAVETMEREQKTVRAYPDALRTIERFSVLREHLSKASRPMLTVAIRHTIRSITLRRSVTGAGELSYTEYTGTAHLQPFLTPQTIFLSDQQIGPVKRWREIGDFIKQAKRPVHIRDVQERFGIKDVSLAAYHIRRAVRAGVITKLDKQGGWTSR